ncbi:hypothetical protein AMECASPLE_014533 [Ameca splendens]|uniref:Uncharacterized protein n=1 Tax=Ameca splendens TaxID=208324 RepID=A0ABV0Y1I8_9TELE
MRSACVDQRHLCGISKHCHKDIRIKGTPSKASKSLPTKLLFNFLLKADMLCSVDFDNVVSYDVSNPPCWSKDAQLTDYETLLEHRHCGWCCMATGWAGLGYF